MPRVVSGTAKGLRLDVPKGMGTRPTSDRVKEALFSILAPILAGVDVLDLFAGTGQLGIEALSRGARSAVFVDRDRGSVACIRSNLERAGMSARAVVVGSSTGPALGRLAAEGHTFGLVLVDPPYDRAIAAFRDAATRLQESGTIRPEAILVLEHDAKHLSEPDVINLQRFRSCKYGGTMLTFYRRKTPGIPDSSTDEPLTPDGAGKTGE